MKFKLTDPETGKSVTGRVVGADSTQLSIFIDGYGDYSSATGRGYPLFVEYYDGQLRVVCYPDINGQEPEIVYLEGARESYRRED